MQRKGKDKFEGKMAKYRKLLEGAKEAVNVKINK